MFWGREKEIADLNDWQKKTSKLTILYGRRRVGKTCLVEEAFKGSSLFKVEGLEGANGVEQKKIFLHSMAEFFNKPELKQFRPDSWITIFSMLSDLLGNKSRIIFLDEFQWLASGRTTLVSQLKYAWDNFFSKKNKVLLILCGSVSSFMVNQVLKSTAMYGRVDQEIHLQPLRIKEIQDTFTQKRSIKEFIELYMILGGIPQYLKMVDLSKSVRLNIEKLCFLPNGYLVNEFERLFASHFGKNIHYRNILISLAKNGWASRDKLKRDCKIDSGGRISEYLSNLELAGFIESYTPVDKPNAERNLRFRIIDQYLLFYFKFIHHKRKKINQLKSSSLLTHFLPDRSYKAWLALAFERICLLHQQEIAAKLGFGAVNYEAGSWFAKGEKNLKTQIDLIYIRADNVITVCEIKFTDSKVGIDVIKDIERKIEIFPNSNKRTIEKVLITVADPTKQLLDEGYFHKILTLEELFS